MLNPVAFLRHYNNFPYVPFQIVPDLAPRQVAIFAERLSGQPDLDLETEPVRNYPNGEAAAHVLGYVQRVEPEGRGKARLSRDAAGLSGSLTRICAGSRGSNPSLSITRTIGSGNDRHAEPAGQRHLFDH